MTRFLRGSSSSDYSSFAVAPSAQIASAADQDATAAIQQVIQHSNDEQVQAIASHDSSVMADTATADHYQDLVAGQPGPARQRREQHQPGQPGVGRRRRQRLVGDRHDLRDLANASSRTAPSTSPATATTTRWSSTTAATGRSRVTTTPTRSRLRHCPPRARHRRRSHSPSPMTRTRRTTGRATPRPGGTYTQVTGTWSVPQFNTDNSVASTRRGSALAACAAAI